METILGPLFPLSFFALLGIERLARGGTMPPVRRWLLTGIAFFVVAMAVNVTLPPLLASWLGPFTPIDLAGLGVVGGAAITFLATSFADYWLHRAMHRSNTLWRWAHQLHHSAERVDMAGFAYVHPTELLLAVGLTTLVGTLLGANPDGVMLAGYLYFVAGLIQHFNVRTPTWLGWFVQRPEAHRVHHTRGVHAYNYGLPLWDAAFGTRRNPPEWNADYGFWAGSTSRLGAMLIGRDVSEPSA